MVRQERRRVEHRNFALVRLMLSSLPCCIARRLKFCQLHVAVAGRLRPCLCVNLLVTLQRDGESVLRGKQCGKTELLVNLKLAAVSLLGNLLLNPLTLLPQLRHAPSGCRRVLALEDLCTADAKRGVALRGSSVERA